MESGDPWDLTRREFIAGAVSLTTTLLLAERRQIASLLKPAKPKARGIVIIHLAGGNDPWNCTVLRGDQIYKSSRPTIAIAADTVLNCSRYGMGLHPSLGGIARLLRRGNAAIVCGVGISEGEDSHALATLAWEEAAMPFGIPRDGWACQAARISPDLVLWTDSVHIPRSFCLRDRSTDLRSRLIHAFNTPSNLDTSVVQASLGNRLEKLADFIASEDRPFIAQLTLNGFDTHSHHCDIHARLLSEFGNGLEMFERKLVDLGQQDHVLTIAFSEMGRSLAENDHGGVDHAASSLLFAVGEGINAGVHGRLSTADPNRCNFDFRCVHATVLNDWLGIAAEPILRGHFGSVPILRVG